jgi:hypothetical protein
MSRYVIALLGWAVPADWFTAHLRAQWPDAEIQPIAASPRWADELAAAPAAAEIVAYSLGALLLATRPTLAANRPVTLLAPIAAFTREAARGGRMPRAALAQLQRRLARAPHAAVTGFYQHIGLADADPTSVLADGAALAWGLAQLDTLAAPTPWPAHWRGALGDADPLLAPTALLAEWPALRIVADATHHAATLLHGLVP